MFKLLNAFQGGKNKMSKKTMKLLAESAPIFNMLQDDNRQQILLLLFDKHALSVTELTDQLSLSRPAVSHHLKLLLDAGLISFQKNGKERIYRLNLEPSYNLLKSLLNSLEHDMKMMS